nr:MAG: hypothetical protein EDM05_32160 [Leptolyngbya sp. IPPAS B-1204]
MSFEVEITENQPEFYLPFYINNDGKSQTSSMFTSQGGIDILNLELGAGDSSIGFSQETYILQEQWDTTPGDVKPFWFGSAFGFTSGELRPSESDLSKMFLVDGKSRPAEVPKVIEGGKFTEATVVIEDAQSLAPPLHLDNKSNTYAVTTSLEVIYAKAGNDHIIGSNLDKDYLFGEAGNDTLRGGLNDDTLNGGSDNDLLYGEGNSDVLFGMMGDDILWGDYERDDKIQGGNGISDGGGDILNGGSGNDVLYGGLSSDILFGGDGIDFLNVGQGYTNLGQSLIGGAGADRFDFSHILSSQTPGFNIFSRTRILDFNAAEGDKIGIYVGENYFSNFRNIGLPVNTSISAKQFHLGEKAANKDHRFIYSPEGQELYFDPDGNGGLPQERIAVFTQPPGSTPIVKTVLTHKDIVTFDDSKRLPPPSSFSISPLNKSKNEASEAKPGPIDTTQLAIHGNTQSSPNNISSDAQLDKHITGSSNNDKLVGTAESDKIFGGKGNDTLRGESGNDWLYGGLGSDKLIGGKGRDVFVLEKGKGRDQIIDFKDKQDQIGLPSGIRFKKLEITSQGQDTLISLGKDQLAILKGVQRNQLSVADFTPVQLLPLT